MCDTNTTTRSRSGNAAVFHLTILHIFAPLKSYIYYSPNLSNSFSVLHIFNELISFLASSSSPYQIIIIKRYCAHSRSSYIQLIMPRKSKSKMVPVLKRADEEAQRRGNRSHERRLQLRGNQHNPQEMSPERARRYHAQLATEKSREKRKHYPHVLVEKLQTTNTEVAELRRQVTEERRKRDRLESRIAELRRSHQPQPTYLFPWDIPDPEDDDMDAIDQILNSMH